MAVDLYKAKTKGYKELYLVEGAKHAEALEVNKILYEKDNDLYRKSIIFV